MQFRCGQIQCMIKNAVGPTHPGLGEEISLRSTVDRGVWWNKHKCIHRRAEGRILLWRTHCCQSKRLHMILLKLITRLLCQNRGVSKLLHSALRTHPTVLILMCTVIPLCAFLPDHQCRCLHWMLSKILKKALFHHWSLWLGFVCAQRTKAHDHNSIC